MTPLVVVGIDGAPADVLSRFEMRFLARLAERGRSGPLASTTPAATLPAWTSAWTGVGPGGHGVFDFTRREGRRVRFVGGSARRARTVFRSLADAGRRVGLVGFPATYPPESLAGGFVVSGWDSPVAHRGDASFVWPRELFDWIVARHGPIRFDDVNEFRTNDLWFAGLAARLIARVERRAALVADLIEHRRPDALFVYFGESDTASHHLWSFYDPASPRRPARVSADLADGLGRVYRAIDRAAERIVSAMRRTAGEPRVIALSDHGSGGASDKVLHLNRALAEAGLLRFRGGPARRWPSRVRSMATRVLSPRLREAAFRLNGGALGSWLESRVRFGSIDFARTAAFSEELNYAPSVWLEDPAAARDVEQALVALCDPWSGRPVVRTVRRREEVYEGPFVAEAPDLLLDLDDDGGYTYCLLPSSSAPTREVWRRLAARERLGQKGAALAGSHRPAGVVLANFDATLPSSIEGIAFLVGTAAGVPFRPAGRGGVDGAGATRDGGIVLERLRALGYLD